MRPMMLLCFGFPLRVPHRAAGRTSLMSSGYLVIRCMGFNRKLLMGMPFALGLATHF